jgi:hypothetical protein
MQTIDTTRIFDAIHPFATHDDDAVVGGARGAR